MTRAVVFAYHNVGVRCLKALMARGVEVPLVVTHADNPAESIWFESVAATAGAAGIPVMAPADPNAPAVVTRIADCKPDFLFSFYYRLMLKAPLLSLAPRGALNMHGSLLPKYRGRVPVNWAIINGETETGATLHYMTERPDAGDIVAQSVVAILPDETAKEVFDKVTLAAEQTLTGMLPDLIAGTAPRVPQDLSRGSYFRGRRPEDGIIDWSRDAVSIHNLVRAVAPPYPGARTELRHRPARVLRTRVISAADPAPPTPTLAVEGERIVARCGGGGTLAILDLEIDGAVVPAGKLRATCGGAPISLPRR
jgi:methionyl-tRNA formyltransferase